MVEDEEALLGFVEAAVDQWSGFFLGQVVCTED
jgi:hypothetical protein